MSEVPDLLRALQDSLEQGRSTSAVSVSKWTCAICGQDADAHNTCPECFHCPGYPHDYGCEQ